MDMVTPREHYNQALKSLDRAVERGHVSERDADAIKEFAAAYNEDDVSVPSPEGEGTRAYGTLRSYVNNLRRTAKVLDVDVVDATIDEINDFVNEMLSDGKSKNTVRNYQNNLRRFYHYHDFAVDREDIQLVSNEEPSVDDRDMLTKEEIQQIREAAEHPRDLCIFDLLLYTGQRNTALRTLRIKDIDLEERVYYLNTDADGLKGAEKRGRKRPLLGAVGSVREWLRYHPHSDNPDAYLLTPKPRYRNVDPDEPISRETMAYAMNQLKEETGIDKPMNPHSIRHNFVTIAKREYGLDDMHIKKLIGHRDGSNVMETTYAHLSDDDVIKAAEEGADIREPEEESSLTPEVCHCGEPLPDHAKACPRCGTVYAPDAQNAKDQIQEDIKQDYRGTDPEDTETMEKLDKMDEILDDPEVKALIAEKMSEK